MAGGMTGGVPTGMPGAEPEPQAVTASAEAYVSSRDTIRMPSERCRVGSARGARACLTGLGSRGPLRTENLRAIRAEAFISQRLLELLVQLGTLGRQPAAFYAFDLLAQRCLNRTTAVRKHSPCHQAVHLARSVQDHERHDHRRSRARSEEHTSELQSRFDLVCRLLLEKKKINTTASKSRGARTCSES